MERGRALRAAAPRLAVCGTLARRLRGGRAHAGRGLHDPPRPARRVCAPRRGAPPAARAQGCAADRVDLRRHDSGNRRLHRRARTAGRQDRHRQRGLRGREPGRRHLPARQRQLPHPASRAGTGARRGRSWRAADDPVLARRGAGAQRRALVRRRAAARGGRRAAARGRCRGRDRMAERERRPRRRSGAADRRLPRPHHHRARRRADAAAHRHRALLRCQPAACSW